MRKLGHDSIVGLMTLPGALAIGEGDPASGPAAGREDADSQPVTAPAAPGVIRVAVVDDDVTIRSLVRMLLSRTEDLLLVGDVADGADALDMVRATNPDVVLIDLLMPRMGGHELLPMLVRESPATMPLVLSALQAIDEADRSFTLGAFAYLEKSVVGPGLAGEIRDLYGLFSRALSGETVWTPSGPRRIRS
jgi:DNA-binding NarL/FixJ family response regulator